MEMPQKLTRIVRFRITKDQLVSLKNKADYHGFASISQYCRFILIHDFDMERRIKELHEKILGGK